MSSNNCKFLLLVVIMTRFIPAYGQTVISSSDGPWTNPSTWVGGVVPTTLSATEVIVNHDILISQPDVLAVSNVTVNGKLTLASGAVLNIVSDGSSTQALRVTGVINCQDSSQLNGTSTDNTIFDSGSLYIHHQGPGGFIPMATWHASSTIQISGFTSSGYINIAHSEGWKQNFGNVVYDCPAQTIFVVDFNGYLRNVAGTFSIRNTNNKTLRLSTTQNPTINVAGDFIVEGNSEVWFSTNSTACQVNIGGKLIYRSTSTGPSYLTTRGVVTIKIVGDMEMSSAGPIRMASSAPDSVGTRQSTLLLGGNLTMLSGTLIAPPPGSGKGRIHFQGPGVQRVTASGTGTSFQGNMEYDIGPSSMVDLGTSMLSSDQGSLHVQGSIAVGSLQPAGAIQTGGQGNIRVPGLRTFEPGSTIIYNGAGPQVIGNGHPVSMNVNLTGDNASILTLTTDLTVGDFTMRKGSFNNAGHQLMIAGDVTFDQVITTAPSAVTMVGAKEQSLSCAGLTVDRLEILKSGSAAVNLTSSLSILHHFNILSTNTVFNASGNLRLLSVSDDVGGTASVGPIPLGSSIEGDVTVERYMSGEGRIYRYLASSVYGASVASLMDDFPVTGSFQDPSSGIEINSGVPSLFLYDESAGGLMQGWRPFPTTGTSSDNLLQPGMGYCAFIRSGIASTVFDLTGKLNQGDVALPIGFTGNGAPGNGWNLVGNPYASTIDWDAAGSQGWTKNNVSSVISIRDNGAGGIFHYWDGDENSSDLPNGHVASGQSFWLRATGPNPMLIAREGVKVAGDATFYRKSATDIPCFGLFLSGGSLADRAFFKVRKGSTNALDDWDAVKLPNDQLNLSFIDHQGNSLAIDARGKFPRAKEIIPVLIDGLSPGTYRIQLVVRFGFENYRYAWVDHFLNTEQIMEPGLAININVTDEAGSRNNKRFTIWIEPLPAYEKVADTLVTSLQYDTMHNGMTTATVLRDSIQSKFQSANMGTSLLLYPNPACATLCIAADRPISTTIRIVDSTGKDLGAFRSVIASFSSHESTVDVTSLPPGLYVAIVRTAAGMTFARFEKCTE